MAVTFDRSTQIITFTAANDEVLEALDVDFITCRNAATAGSWTFTSGGKNLPSVYTAANVSVDQKINRMLGAGIKLTALPAGATGAYIVLKKR